MFLFIVVLGWERFRMTQHCISSVLSMFVYNTHIYFILTFHSLFDGGFKVLRAEEGVSKALNGGVIVGLKEEWHGKAFSGALVAYSVRSCYQDAMSPHFKHLPDIYHESIRHRRHINPLP